jgi:uncharacterized protein (TIGR03437 family)
MKQRSAAAVISLCWIGIATLPASCQAQTLTTLATFVGTIGSSALVQGTDGNFYGTTNYGGTSFYGSVFRITPGGTLTILYSFTGGADGWGPQSGRAGLIQASDGNLYGTTFEGGTDGEGTVFRITTGGTLTTLYSFCSQTYCTDGTNPVGGVIQASDGNLYGTTSQGGTGYGTVFRITTGGTLTTLHSFTSNGAEGFEPQGGLIQASDGNLYGATLGAVFRITLGGTLTTLYSFTGGASFIQHGLIQASDGNLYGTTYYSGTGSADGAVVRITTGGTLTTLYSFCSQTNCADGTTPAGLIQASDGNLYGTTQYGGANDYGTVFRITTGGTLTTLYSFTGADGSSPKAGVIQASDGNLYGTTESANGGGTVFRLTIPAPLQVAPTINAVVNGASFVGGGVVPGEIATLFGTNLTSSTGINLTSGLPLPNTFLTDSLMVNTHAAALFAVDNVNGQQQINFQVPWEAASGPMANITIEHNTAASASLSVPVLAAQPGIFNYTAGGDTFGAILHANFQLANTANPAKPGETVLIYCTGLGAVSSPPADGAAGNGQETAATPTVTIGGTKAIVSFSGLAPGFVGLYQINAEVPAGLKSGNQAVVITLAGASSNSVLLPIA